MTQEELEGNNIVAAYMQEYTTEYLIWKKTDISKLVSVLEYSSSMDWLYPVYQEIIQFADSDNPMFNKLDTYCRALILSQQQEIRDALIEGKNVSELFKEIVEWIKIYNEKVLEDDKT